MLFAATRMKLSNPKHLPFMTQVMVIAIGLTVAMPIACSLALFYYDQPKDRAKELHTLFANVEFWTQWLPFTILYGVGLMGLVAGLKYIFTGPDSSKTD